jgi:hypothetical protein
MRRLIAATALAVAALAPAALAAPPTPGVGNPGGKCDGVVDTMCRNFVCGPDDLDCGMIPPCLLWVYLDGCVIG